MQKEKYYKKKGNNYFKCDDKFFNYLKKAKCKIKVVSFGTNKTLIFA